MCPGCDKVTRRERNLQGSSSPRGCPGDPVYPLSLSVLLLMCFLLNLGNVICSNQAPQNSPSQGMAMGSIKEKATGIVWQLAWKIIMF